MYTALMDWGNRVTYFAKTAFKKDGVVSFGIKDADRLEHLVVMGRAKSGRAPLLAGMALQDIKRGMSTIVLDASGALTPMLLEALDEPTRERLVFLDPSDGGYPFSWNPVSEFKELGMRAVPLLSDAIASVYSIKPSELTTVGAELILKIPNATILLLYTLVTDENEREKIFGTEIDERARFEALLQAEAESVAVITEQGRYIAKDTLVRNLFGQPTSKFSLAQGSAGALIVVDLSRIRMFPTRITPLVRMLIHAARARGAMGENISLYLYDCLRYVSEEDIEKILPERKVVCTFATSDHEEEKIMREVLLRRAGSVVTFAPSVIDFPLMEKVFYPYISPDDLAKLKENELCVALTIDSVRARPFFAQTLERPERAGVSYQDLHVLSRGKYTISRFDAEKIFRTTSSDKDTKGKDGTPGSFSDTFKSIFAKRGVTPAPGDTPAVATPTAKDATAVKLNPKETAGDKKTAEVEKKETPPVKPSEISERDLRHMMYVEPIGA